MRTLLISLLIALPAMAQTQPPPLKIVEGDWTFIIDNKIVITARVFQPSPPALFGVFVSGAGGTSPAFSGTTFNPPIRGMSFGITWNSTSRDIPGAASDFIYWGTLSPDGKSVSGSYGLGAVFGPVSGSWSGGVTGTLSGTPLPAVATEPVVCTAKMVAGAYSFLLAGLVQSEAGPVTVHALGRFVSDSNGNLTGFQDATGGGAILSRILTGSYSVSRDCIAALQFTDDAGVRSSFKGAMSSGGRTIQLLQMDVGTVVSGAAYQQ